VELLSPTFTISVPYVLTPLINRSASLTAIESAWVLIFSSAETSSWKTWQLCYQPHCCGLNICQATSTVSCVPRSNMWCLCAPYFHGLRITFLALTASGIMYLVW
jgi:hypothetical protein